MTTTTQQTFYFSVYYYINVKVKCQYKSNSRAFARELLFIGLFKIDLVDIHRMVLAVLLGPLAYPEDSP